MVVTLEDPHLAPHNSFSFTFFFGIAFSATSRATSTAWVPGACAVE
jgi:hypothetical protein